MLNKSYLQIYDTVLIYRVPSLHNHQKSEPNFTLSDFGATY